MGDVVDPFQQMASRVVARNQRELTACALVAAGSLVAVGLGALPLLPGVLLALGTVPVAAVLLWVAPPATDRPPRDEMLRQARLLEWVPLWYLAPLVPGVVALLVIAGRNGGFRAGLVGVVFAAVFAAVAWLNRRGAAYLRALAEQAPIEA